MRKRFGSILTVILSAAVAFFVSVVMLDQNVPGEGSPMSLVAEADTPSAETVAAQIAPSVVGVSALDVPHSFSAPTSSASMGSGVIVSENGYVLTNHHVIGQKRNISITLSDGRTVQGKRTWSDEALDIALVKIEETGLRAAPLGDSSAASVGQTVLAIGNPLSLQFQRTVTAGIISATDRILYMPDTGSLMENLLQTDASINPGNSGGPLVNLKGEVLGINTIKARDAEGMGFAIAVNLCRPIVERIVAEGKYEMPYLGLYAYDRETAQYIEAEAPPRGLLITEVAEKSPARRAGLKKGDCILAFMAEPLDRMAQLREKLLACRVGETITLDILRDGTPFTATVTLEKEPLS